MSSLPTPSPTDDPIIRLFDYYFTAADVIFKEFDKLWLEWGKKGRLSESKTLKMQRFAQVWLAMLFVTAEGFKSEKVKRAYNELAHNNLKMRIHWDSIEHKMTQLGSELKIYRNSTFHFQETMSALEAKRLALINHAGRHEPIAWAKELHLEMRSFFSCYRVEACVRFLQKRD